MSGRSPLPVTGTGPAGWHERTDVSGRRTHEAQQVSHACPAGIGRYTQFFGGKTHGIDPERRLSETLGAGRIPAGRVREGNLLLLQSEGIDQHPIRSNIRLVGGVMDRHIGAGDDRRNGAT